MDVRSFLRTCPPLDTIDEEALSDVVRQTQIAFFPSGTTILELPESRPDTSSVPVAAPHEAFDDALVTAQLFLVPAEQLRGRGITTVGDLLRAGR